MNKKIHWNDQHGPICGAFGGVNYIGYDWRKVVSQSLREVTCKRCIKKLVEIGFSLAEFAQVVRETKSQLPSFQMY